MIAGGGSVIVMPAHNEGAVIGDLLAELIGNHPWPVVVVDDASSDSTAATAAAAGATVLRLPVQLGAWGAMQAGMRYALRHGYRRVVTVDADGQHPADQIPSLLIELQRPDVEVVIGACTTRGSLLRRFAWRLFRMIGRLPIDDLTSGFRAYDRRAVELLASPDATLLEYQDVGVLLLLREEGLKVVEVEVEMRPRDPDRSGHSRIFYSWRAVLYYMIHTTVLCMARGRRSSGLQSGRARAAGYDLD